MDNAIIEYLAAVHGIRAPGAFYSKIAEWDAWRRGFYKPFHTFMEGRAAGLPVARELYRLNMAQKICEDWAAVLLNDRTVLSIADETGEAFVKRAFAENGFIRQANRLIEKVFAVGTGAVILRLTDCPVDSADGSLCADGTTKLSFEFVDAAHILPLSVQNGRITEAAFVSEGVMRGKEYVYLETHTVENGGYCIRNVFFDRENGVLHERDEGQYARVIRTRSPVPFFSIITIC